MAAGVAPEGARQSSSPEGGRQLKALLDSVEEARARWREAERRTADVLRALPDSVRIAHAGGNRCRGNFVSRDNEVRLGRVIKGLRTGRGQ